MRTRRRGKIRTLLSTFGKARILLLFSFVLLLIWLLTYGNYSVPLKIIHWPIIPIYVPQIPRYIIQTSKHSSDIDIASNSFVRLNPTYKYFLYNDSAADDFVRQTMPDYIYLAYASLPKPILKADYFRYIALLVQGGIYTDTDTICLRPIDTWAEKSTMKNVGLMIGIEADASLWDIWQGDYARQIQFVQWTIAAAPGHPILHHIVQRIADISPDMMLKDDSIERTMEWTGPAIWTDVISSYLWRKYRFRWQYLRKLEKATVVGEDICVLPITGFSPGLKRMGSKSIHDREARVQHIFSGSWKSFK